ncbi:MAG: hypothetical protein ABI693_01435 [Bryobacteraceae bacterium]
MRGRLRAGSLAITALVLAGSIPVAMAGDDPDPIAPVARPINHERMFGVMPDYQTVRDPKAVYVPLTARQKWHLVGLSTLDPFNLCNAFIGAGLSQIDNDTPRYGWGGKAYGYRAAAAFADLTTQGVISGGLAVLFHQDPRYFRKGPEANIPRRAAYAISRIFIARHDSGRSELNTANLLGLGLGIGASNAYYPSASRTGTVMFGRLQTSLTGDVIGNLMSEFWPDIHERLFHRRHKTP